MGKCAHYKILKARERTLMLSKFKISLKRIIDEYSLEVLYMPQDPANIFIHSTDVSRPSLQLAGFTEIFDNSRVQVFGKTEISYLDHMDKELAAKRCDGFFALHSPVAIVCNNLHCEDYLIDAAKRHGVPLLRTPHDTCEVISALIYRLNITLAPRITRHGVLMEIYGEGTLILGDSSVGKSETAVELIARGHRLIGDDAVEIRRTNSQTLVGSAPSNIRHFMELRGIGIINARRIFGMGSVNVTQRIRLIIKLEPWDDAKHYDRFGSGNEYMEIMGVRIPMITIPVKPGRNIAVVIETAVMNFRLKRFGYNATRELMRGLGLPDDEEYVEPKIVTDPGWDSEEGTGIVDNM